MENIVQYFNVPNGGINSLYFHPNGEQLLASSRVGLLLYRINNKARPFTFNCPKGQPFNAVRGILSHDGSYACGVSSQGQIALWKIHVESPCLLKTAHQATINDMSTWECNDYIATASHDKSVMIWDLNNLEDKLYENSDDPKKKLRYVTSFPHHNSPVTSVACCPTMSIILSGEAHGAVALWDVRAQDKSTPLWAEPSDRYERSPVVSLNFESHGVLFAISRDRQRVLVRDIRFPDNVIPIFGEEIDPDQIQTNFSTSFPALPSCTRFSPMAPKLIVTGTQGHPTIYDLEDQRLGTDLQGHDLSGGNRITAVEWSPDAKMIATADQNGMVIVWKTPRIAPPKNTFTTAQQISIPPTKPFDTALTPEALYIQLKFMNAHLSQLDQHLAHQEQKIMNIASNYPSIGDFTVYDV